MLRILEVGIGLALVFTLIALICSVINEWISAMLEKRGNLLWEGIEKLVDKQLRADICGHQLMQGLVRKQTWFDAILKRIMPWIDRAKPSYVPTEVFVATLLDILGARAAAGGNPQTMGQLPTTFEGLQTAIQNAQGVPDHVKQALLALVNNAGNKVGDDLAKAKKLIGGWFDAGMDRVTGWYKRWSQLILLLVSLIVAFVLGVDCVAIAKRLWTDPVLREQVADAAEDFVEERKNDPRVAANRAVVDTATAGETPLTSDLPLTSDTEPATEAPLTSDVAPAETAVPAAAQPTGTTESSEELAKRKIQEIHVFQNQLEALSLPMYPLAGLQTEYEQYAKSHPEEPVLTSKLGKLGWWLSRHLLGLLLTSLAASLGAPFWFDVLNRFVNLRNTGKKPAETPAKP